MLNAQMENHGMQLKDVFALKGLLIQEQAVNLYRRIVALEFQILYGRVKNANVDQDSQRLVFSAFVMEPNLETYAINVPTSQILNG